MGAFLFVRNSQGTAPATRVGIFQPRVPRYRRAFFRQLIELGSKSGIEYKVYAPINVTDPRQDEDFSNIDVTRVRSVKFKIKGRIFNFINPIKILRNSDFIISEHALHDTFFLMSIFHLVYKPYGLWGHGRNYTTAQPKILESFKIAIAKKANWFFTYTDSGAKHLISKNLESSKLTILNNSIDVTKTREALLAAKLIDPNEIREKYCIQSEFCLLFIGGIDESKRIDFLIHSAVLLKEKGVDFTLAVCGSGSQSHLLTGLDALGIKLFGFANETQKAELATISSVILNPGRVGLIAVDSLALECPIVTTDWNLHAPEFDYLENNSNAVITSNSVNSYSDSVISILRDPARLKSLKKQCAIDSFNFSVEKMVQNFHSGVLEMTARKYD